MLFTLLHLSAPGGFQALCKHEGRWQVRISVPASQAAVNPTLRRSESKVTQRARTGIRALQPSFPHLSPVLLRRRRVCGKRVARRLSREQGQGFQGSRRPAAPRPSARRRASLPAISCLSEQSISTEKPKHRATCPVVFPKVLFHCLNYLIDEPFLFRHPR